MVRPAESNTPAGTCGARKLMFQNPYRRGEGGISYASYVTRRFESRSRLTLIAPRHSDQQLRSLLDLTRLLAVTFYVSVRSIPLDSNYEKKCSWPRDRAKFVSDSLARILTNVNPVTCGAACLPAAKSAASKVVAVELGPTTISNWLSCRASPARRQ